jgi:plasmid replication initiation protein
MEKSLVVVKANKVIEASYKLSVPEQRVLLACIAKIDSMAILSADTPFEISAESINDLSELDSLNNAYKTLRIAAKRLFERKLIIDDPDSDKPKIRQRETRWISTIDYIPGEGKVILFFAPGIIPYLSQLTHEFTKYKLEYVSKFQSMYSIRLYELLTQWLKIGKRDIELDWLKNQFQIDDKYNRVTHLQTRVVNVAITEINEYSNIWVKCKPRKAGRTITHFCFEFGLKKPEKLTKTQITKQLIPDFKGHPDYQVDSEAVLADHERLKTKPAPKPKKILDSDKQSKITGLKRAVTHG